MFDTITLTLVSEECCNCGIIFGMTRETKKRLLESHECFYCPKGHSQYYTGKSEAEKLRDELAREKQKSEQTEANLRNQVEWHRKRRESAENQKRAQKGAMTKLKNRIGNGVCPCCTRSFQNLQRHIANQHPEFKHEETKP